MAVDKKLVATRAKEAGWDVDLSRPGELRLVPPDGPVVVFGTEKNRQGGHREGNDLATLRRLGLPTDDLHSPRLCEHSWHVDGRPGRACPYCRGTWRRPADTAPPEPTPEPTEPPREEPVMAQQHAEKTQAPADPEPVETISYEVATIDGKGRLVLRDPNGDLFVAVPLLPQL